MALPALTVPSALDPAAPTLATAAGGISVPVTFRRPEIMPESVFVRDLFPSQMNEYASLSNELTGLVEFVCQKPKGWADTLSVDSLFELHAKVEERNDPLFSRWLARVAPRVSQMATAGRV